MNQKVTKVRPSYPVGEAPNLCIPQYYNKYNRFLLGRLGKRPLVAICMNPSAANEEYSDRTINRIIGASQKLECDGWIVANIYPERATNASELDEFNLELATENVRLIINFLLEHGINEVWGAWGNLGHPSLQRGKKLLLSAFKQNDIRVYSFAPLTKWGQPKHPLNRSVKQNFSLSNKIYIEF